MKLKAATILTGLSGLLVSLALWGWVGWHQQIFSEALEEQGLPAFTEFVISSQWMLPALGISELVLAVWMISRPKHSVEDFGLFSATVILVSIAALAVVGISITLPAIRLGLYSHSL